MLIVLVTPWSRAEFYGNTFNVLAPMLRFSLVCIYYSISYNLVLVIYNLIKIKIILVGYKFSLLAVLPKVFPSCVITAVIFCKRASTKDLQSHLPNSSWIPNIIWLILHLHIRSIILQRSDPLTLTCTCCTFLTCTCCTYSLRSKEGDVFPFNCRHSRVYL